MCCYHLKPQREAFLPLPFPVQARNSYLSQEAGCRENADPRAVARGEDKRHPTWHEHAWEAAALFACAQQDGCLFRLCSKMLSPKAHGAPVKGHLSWVSAWIQENKTKKRISLCFLGMGPHSFFRYTLEIKLSRLQGHFSTPSFWPPPILRPYFSDNQREGAFPAQCPGHTGGLADVCGTELMAQWLVAGHAHGGELCSSHPG